MLNVQTAVGHKRLYDFIVECKHLFLRNVYSSVDLDEMNISDIEKYYEIIDWFLELFPVVENALDDGDRSVEFKDFMLEDLDGAYSTLSERKKT